MTKNKILVLLVAVLLLVNIVLLYFLFSRPHGRGPGRAREAAVKEFLQKEIGFGTQQLQQYDTLSTQHREKMRAGFERMRAEKMQELKQLAADKFADSAIMQAVSQPSAGQREMELMMMQHFKNIRNLCTPEQQPRFDSLCYKMMGRRGGKKPGGEK
jgi:periplasmic protein CpxP/Spy